MRDRKITTIDESREELKNCYHYVVNIIVGVFSGAYRGGRFFISYALCNLWKLQCKRGL